MQKDQWHVSALLLLMLKALEMLITMVSNRTAATLCEPR